VPADSEPWDHAESEPWDDAEPEPWDDAESEPGDHAESETGRHTVTSSSVSSRTEERNWRTVDIDLVPTEQVLRILNAEDATVAGAVAAVIPALAAVVDRVVERLRAGGQVHYFGAGTSGRIGVLDAAEVIPTFGLRPGVFVAHHAGGDRALGTAVEDAEDDEALGHRDARAVSAGDVAVGITASGRTPYVAGALRSARSVGAVTVLVSSNPAAPLAPLAQHRLLMDTGPEAIAGSTRLKAATAQKMVLNALSTAAMVRLGRTYSNLMAAMSGSNAKLRQRQVTILHEASGADEELCRAELERCGGDLRLALLCLLSGLEPKAAADALTQAGGGVRAALSRLAERA
jgi:N-acetylmuramic acid 6-phosphate etherase